MAAVYYIVFIFSIYFSSVVGKLIDLVQNQLITAQEFMLWPNATVPFYVNPEHFDHEQSLKILTALSMFAFKTCLKFAPVMALPSSNEHVMVFVNPTGVKRCEFDSQGHSFYEPHLVTLGYDCLKSPHIEMIIMKALGFPFEHNREARDDYIEIILENVDPGFIDLFTRDVYEPLELRMLPYDFDSVMHFGNREFSKNGHRTIIFKDPTVQQNRVGLTANDVRKFDFVYGPECLKRDRQEKIDICQSYPGVARRKRETEQKDENKKEETKKDDFVTLVVTKSLRVNPHITPSPLTVAEDEDVSKTLRELGIKEQVQGIVENIYKVSETALSNARTKYCKVDGKLNMRTQDEGEKNTDILGIINLVSDYVKGMVDKAVSNMTEFCEGSESMAVYLRARCDWRPYDPRCSGGYKSTKNGPMRFSTRNRPYIPQSTYHGRFQNDHKYVPILRDGNSTVVVSEDKKETSASKDGGENPTTEKMKVEKSALRFGATGPPKNRKSLRRHRSVIKRRHTDDGLTISSENVQTHRHSANFNNEENENNSENKELVIEIRSDEAINKRKLEYKGYGSENEEGSQQSDEIPNSEALYQADAVPTREIKIHNYAQIVPNQNNRYKIKNKDYSGEKPRKRFKKQKTRDNSENFDPEERENQESTQIEELAEDEPQVKYHKEIEEYEPMTEDHRVLEDDEPKRPVLVNESEERQPAKKQKKRQKKIRENNKNININGDQAPKEKRTELEVPQTITLTKQNKEFYKDRKWPGGIVRYVLKSGLGYDENNLRQRLEEVNRILKQRTCVRLKEITENEAENVEDFLVIDDSPDYVTGRVGGRQSFGSVELLQGGQHRQHTAMMVMAMLGFYFEVSRHDRDKYIRVHLRHVRPDKLHHFEKIRSDATLDIPYDYKSATHPAWQFWRQYGRSGISTVATYKEQDSDGTLMKSLGQNPVLLSESDILKINSIYGVRCFLRTKQKRGRNKARGDQQRI